MATSSLPPISLRAREIPPSGIRRFFDIAATMENVISLGIGEPDFVSPKPVLDAVRRAMDQGATGYSPNAGFLELRQEIAKDYADRYGVSYDPVSEILVTVGVSEALQLAMMVLLDPGDEVLIPEPCFVSYGPTAQFAGATVSYVPTRAENDFEVIAADIRRHITPRTKVLFLAYPNNPTGAVLRRETLEEIAEVVLEHNLFVISDEIYDRLIYGDAATVGHTCLSSIASLRDRTILLGGFSKNYAMTGWRVGYACAPQDLLYGMFKLHQYVIMSAPSISQAGAIAAMRDCQEDVEKMRMAYDERRRIIVNGLREAGLPTFEPQGAFYAFPDVRPSGLTSEQFATQLLEEERVAVVPGGAFGPSGEGFVRCSYATSTEEVKEAVERIKRFTSKRL